MENIDNVTTLHLRNEAQFLTFHLQNGGDLFAINIFKVKEIIKYSDKITDMIQGSKGFVEGIVTIRELNVPIVDLRKWFYYKAELNIDLKNYGIQSDEYIIMVCDFSGILVGIRIYGADRILTKKWGDIVRNDDDNNPSAKTIGYTKFLDGRIVQIVDIEKMAVEAFPWIEEEKEQEMELLRKIDTDKYILIADDSKPVLKILEKIMKKLGLKYFLFNNGKELLDFIHSNDAPDHIGAIITDLEMPVTSGFEVIKQMKTSKEYKHIPIIVNSSMSGSSNEQMAKSLNADGFISKSNPKDLEEGLRKFL
jgi:two-component system chemotaxis response regulator CheV